MDVRRNSLDEAIEAIRDRYARMIEEWRKVDMDGMDTEELDALETQYPRWVNAYQVERCRGGSEEGGWYYDAGEPIACIQVVNVEEAAKAVTLIYELWKESVDDDRPYTSVLGGTDVRIQLEGSIGKDWPEHAPHYE